MQSSPLNLSAGASGRRSGQRRTDVGVLEVVTDDSGGSPALYRFVNRSMLAT
jgi:hypothetical protein